MSTQPDILERIEAHLILLIDKVNRIEDWIDERTPPPPPKPEGVLYCHMVKKNVGHGRGCSCTTETGCTFLRTHGYPRNKDYIDPTDAAPPITMKWRGSS